MFLCDGRVIVVASAPYQSANFVLIISKLKRPMLAGSGAAQSLGGSNPENFILDSGGLDDGDDLR